jgi:hypothetical protein
MEILKGKALGDRVKKNVTHERDPDEPTDWHAGTDQDPIPIDYYKPLEFYRYEITARNGDKYVRIPQWPHQVYDELAEDPDHLGRHDDDVAEKGWAVGIANHNVPRKGKRLKRTKSGSRTEAEKWKRTAERFEVDLRGAQVDHVIDLGLGGKDLPDNLWPIKEEDNKAAARRMYDEQMVPAPWLPKGSGGMTSVGALPEETVLKIRQLKKP